MCLTLINTISRKRAKTDIICYKVLVWRTTNHSRRLSSPIFQETWNIGEEKTNTERRWTRYRHAIDNGYYHSYEMLCDARSFEDELGGRGLWAETYKCVIPQGAYYYKGYHSRVREGYASKKLRIVEKV